MPQKIASQILHNHSQARELVRRAINFKHAFEIPGAKPITPPGGTQTLPLREPSVASLSQYLSQPAQAPAPPTTPQPEAPQFNALMPQRFNRPERAMPKVDPADQAAYNAWANSPATQAQQRAQRQQTVLQAGIDELNKHERAQRRNTRGDNWNSVAGEPGRWVGENVWDPVSETVGRGLGLSSLFLQGAGGALNTVGLLGGAGYGKLRGALASDPRSQEYWKNFTNQMWENAQQSNDAVMDTRGKLWRGETSNMPYVKVRYTPDGQPQVSVGNNPIADVQRDYVTQAYNPNDPNAGRAANTIFGIGQGAADAAGPVALTAGLSRGLGVLRNGSAGFSTPNLFNPTLSVAPSWGTAGALAGGGTAVGLTANSVMNADTPEAQVDAGQRLFGNTLGGAFLGNFAGNMGNGLLRAGQAAAPAAPAAAATTAAAPAATAAAPVAAPSLVRSTASNVAQIGGQWGSLHMPGWIQSAQDASTARINDAITPSPFVQAQQSLDGGSDAPLTQIPPVFRGDAAKTVSDGQIGTYGTTELMAQPEDQGGGAVAPVNSPIAKQIYDQTLAQTNDPQAAQQALNAFVQESAVDTGEQADFADWLQRTQAYSGPNGEQGTLEPAATAAGVSAYTQTLQETGSKQQAEAARVSAERGVYEDAYKKDQAALAEKHRAELAEMAAAGASDDELTDKAYELQTAMNRADPTGTSAADAINQSLEPAESAEQQEAPPQQEFDPTQHAPDATPEQQQQIVEAKDNIDPATAQAALTDPEVAEQKRTEGEERYKQEQFDAAAANAPTNPQDFGTWASDTLAHIANTWSSMDPMSQLAFGLGVPLGIIGLLSGGVGGFLLAAAGLGAAGAVGAGAGMFGNQAQDATMSAVNGANALIGGESADAPNSDVAPNTASPPPPALESMLTPEQLKNLSPQQRAVISSALNDPKKFENDARRAVAFTWSGLPTNDFGQFLQLPPDIMRSLYAAMPAEKQEKILSGLREAEMRTTSNKEMDRALQNAIEILTKQSAHIFRPVMRVGLDIAQKHFAIQQTKRATQKWAHTPARVRRNNEAAYVKQTRT